MIVSIDVRSVLYYPHQNCGRQPVPVCAGLKDIRLLEDSMPKRLLILAAFVSLAGIVFGGKARQGCAQVQAQAQAAAYAVAAPLDQYFIADKASEIELARSAAPASISDGAEVLVLTKDGYTTAAKGGNGFVCLVERSWAKSTNDAEFWNPKVRAPHCLNAPAAKTYLPIVLLKTKLVLEGKSKVEIGRAVKTALDKKELPALEPNAMCYMMSKQQYLSDDDMHWHPHMMWYVPGDAEKLWGANLPGVPTLAGNVPEDRMTVFLLAVGHWSDGTPAEH